MLSSYLVVVPKNSDQKPKLYKINSSCPNYSWEEVLRTKKGNELLPYLSPFGDYDYGVKLMGEFTVISMDVE